MDLILFYRSLEFIVRNNINKRKLNVKSVKPTVDFRKFYIYTIIIKIIILDLWVIIRKL